MEFAQLKANVANDETPVTNTLYQKDGDPYLAEDGVTPCTISAVGTEAKRVRDARTKITKQMLRSRRARVEAEDLTRNRVAMAAAGLVGWTGFTENGQPWPFTPENVEQFLSVEHVLEQVETLVAQHADFFKNSSNS